MFPVIPILCSLANSPFLYSASNAFSISTNTANVTCPSLNPCIIFCAYHNSAILVPGNLLKPFLLCIQDPVMFHKGVKSHKHYSFYTLSKYTSQTGWSIGLSIMVAWLSLLSQKLNLGYFPILGYYLSLHDLLNNTLIALLL